MRVHAGLDAGADAGKSSTQGLQVQTIHSFAWSLIDGRTADIRGWLESNLQTEIAKEQADHAKGRGRGRFRFPVLWTVWTVRTGWCWIRLRRSATG